MTVTEKDVERLERYVELLREVVELTADIPSAEDLKALPGHLKNLQAINALTCPDDDDRDRLNECLETLKDLQDYLMPTTEEIQAVKQHLENLQAVEDAT